ncbi:MAG: tRNA (adenosine(37)-N6)-dimethylallyltransferase MiaA, partial [Methylocystis sp.]|nr:tRNA (adenosine(37)-N6)-dimethylallyltransferase MiaA [Methylocystis sp.]
MPAETQRRALLIAGPTASGKSAFALDLARRIGGVVINADSMQVYRDLRIITARPTPQEEALAPHRLFGHVDAGVNYSVGRWLADFEATLRDLPEGATPVVVGGTGMYFKAALYGLSDIPAVPDAVRARVR